MRLRILFIFMFVSLFARHSAGQIVPHFTQYFFDPLQINPGIAGSEQGFSGTLIGRQQWVGFAGAPGTGVANFHLPLHKLKSGVGLSIMTDNIGNFNFITATPSFSYKIRNGLNVLHLGLAPSFMASSTSDNWLAVDNKINDSAIPQGAKTGTTIDFNAGAFYKGGKYFVGFSVLNLMAGRVKQLNLNLTRTLFVLGGFQFKVPSLTSVDWTAGFQYRMPLSSSSVAQYDVNLSGVVKEAFILGVNYRAKDSFSPIIGYQKYVASGKIRIGYAYDYNTSALNKANSGSHEIAINYVYIINRPVENEKYKNVRFL